MEERLKRVDAAVEAAEQTKSWFDRLDVAIAGLLQQNTLQLHSPASAQAGDAGGDMFVAGGRMAGPKAFHRDDDGTVGYSNNHRHRGMGLPTATEEGMDDRGPTYGLQPLLQVAPPPFGGAGTGLGGWNLNSDKTRAAPDHRPLQGIVARD